MTIPPSLGGYTTPSVFDNPNSGYDVGTARPINRDVCEETTMETSRRNFLTATGMAAIAAGSCAAATANAVEIEELPVKYDVDILIIGGGIAGHCAALRALELGADPSRVLVIDKMSGEGADYGGSSLLMSGNYLLATEATDEGKKAFADAMYAMTGNTQNYELLSSLAQDANETLDWLIGMGCGYGDPSSTAYECAVTRSMSSDSRTIPVLIDVYTAKGGQLLYGVKAWKLCLNAGGICGAVASDAEGFFKIAAQKVIVATGSFLSNPGMLEEFIGENAGLIIPRTPWSATGDGITMIKEVGGCMAARSRGVKACYLSCTSADNITKAHATRALSIGIAVNLEGKRYCDEATAGKTQLHHRLLMEQPGCTMGMLADSKSMDLLQVAIDSYESMNVPVYTFDTLEEAAAQIGCPSDALISTVEEFNTHVVDDHTEGLANDKTAGAVTIDTPPYYVFAPFKLSSSFLGAGILTDTRACVVGADGNAIPNLYAAGEVQGGFAYDDYFHGANSTKAAVFGYRAGEEAYNSLA